MFEALLHGISIGLLICVLVGPVFFALLGIAIRYSKREAIGFAVGMLLSDVMYALFAYAGVSTLFLSGHVRFWMYILGGIIFILMGANILRNIRTHSNEEKNINLIKEPHFTNFIGQGFITNTLNPAVFFLWIGIVGTSAPSFRHVGATIVFFLAIFCTTFGTDLLKIQLANALKHLLNPKNIYKLHIITGIILIMLGTGTIVKTIFHG